MDATNCNAEAVDGCLSAACQGLEFDCAEIWRRDSVAANPNSKFSCLRVFVQPKISPTGDPEVPSMGTWEFVNKTKAHSLSPLVSPLGQKNTATTTITSFSTTVPPLEGVLPHSI